MSVYTRLDDLASHVSDRSGINNTTAVRYFMMILGLVRRANGLVRRANGLYLLATDHLPATGLRRSQRSYVPCRLLTANDVLILEVLSIQERIVVLADFLECSQRIACQLLGFDFQSGQYDSGYRNSSVFDTHCRCDKVIDNSKELVLAESMLVDVSSNNVIETIHCYVPEISSCLANRQLEGDIPAIDVLGLFSLTGHTGILCRSP